MLFGTAVTHLSHNVLPIDHVQAAAVVPAHEEGTGIIHTEYRAERTGERRLGIIHPHQFHTGAGGIVPADTLHGIFTETAWPAPPFLKAEDPERFFSRILRSALYSLPIKPSRRRKQRNAYFSLSTGFSVAVTRLAFLLISQSAEMKWV